MVTWKILLSRLLVLLLPIMMTMIGESAAASKVPVKAPKISKETKANSTAIVGESDDGEGAASEDEGDDGAADEEQAPPKSKESSNAKGMKSKKGSKSNKDKAKDKKREKKRQKLLEGFRQAEDFHNSWYNLPHAKIKTSLDKLTKFCKVACTKSECMDKEVANNCHLICPTSTIKQCPDPLKEGGDEGPDTEEELGGEAASNDPASLLDDSSSNNEDRTPNVADYIDQADRDLAKVNGEG